MTALLPFKDVQFQWLRLLVQDTELSARAVQLATYLAVVRYNNAEKKAWPSHQTVCKDLGLKSVKTVQRLIKELDGRWFDIKHGNGLKHSTEYVPTKASHKAAQDLREQEQEGKSDKIVRLRPAKGGHSCRETQTNLSRQAGQKCPRKKEKEKTKEKTADQTVIDVASSAGKTSQPTLVFLTKPHFGLERWNTFCETVFGSALERCVPTSEHLGRRGVWLPDTYPPSCQEEWVEHANWMQASGLIAPDKARDAS